MLHLSPATKILYFLVETRTPVLDKLKLYNTIIGLRTTVFR